MLLSNLDCLVLLKEVVCKFENIRLKLFFPIHSRGFPRLIPFPFNVLFGLNSDKIRTTLKIRILPIFFKEKGRGDEFLQAVWYQHSPRGDSALQSRKNSGNIFPGTPLL